MTDHIEESSPKNVYVKYEMSNLESALRQGEIVTNVIQVRIKLETLNSAKPAIQPITHPYAIVVSQDCDLDWDFKSRTRSSEVRDHKRIPSILFCEVTTAEMLRYRDAHSENKDINSTKWKQIQQNKEERYHFFEAAPASLDALNEGLPELGVDFKRYFTIPAEEVYERIQIGEIKRRCFLAASYREHFTSRFYYFQSRVALPQDYESEPESGKKL